MENNFNLRRFASDSFINFVQIILAILLGFGISLVIARKFGASGNGVYELATLLPVVLQWTFNLGTTTSATYYVAHGDHDIPSAVRGNLTLSLWISLIGTLVGFVIAYFGGETFFPSVARPILLIALASLPCLYLRSNLNAILQGLQDFRAYSIVELIPSAVTFAILVLLILFPNQLDSVLGAVLAYLIGNVVGVVAVLLILKRRLGPNSQLFSLRIDRIYLRQMVSYGLRSQLNIISIYLLLRIDVLLVNLLGGGPSSVGIYAIAVVFADRIWLVSGFTSRVILPRIAASEGAETNRTSLSLITTRYTFWLSLLMAIGLALLGQWIIVFIFGAVFQPAIRSLLAILPGVVLFNFGVILSSDIAGRGRPGISAVQASIAFIINLAANVILIPKFDEVGAALASTIAYGYYGIIHIVIFDRMNHTRWFEMCWPTKDDAIYAQRLLNFVKRRLRAG